MTHDRWPLHHFILRMGLGGLSKRRRDRQRDTTHTRVNGRRRSPERNYGDVTADGMAHKCVNGQRRSPARN